MRKNLLLRKRTLTALAATVILCLSMFIGITVLPPIASRLGSVNPLTLANLNPLTFFQGTPQSTADNADPLAKIHSNLHDWIKTGIASDTLRHAEKAVSVIVGTTHTVDMAELSRHMTIRQAFHLDAGYFIQGFVNTPKDLWAINAMKTTGMIIGDQVIEAQKEDSNGPTTNQYWVQHIIGNDKVQAQYPDIDGEGVVIGIVDTGTDFGHTDLADAYHTNSSGYPTSFDPGGTGLAVTEYTLEKRRPGGGAGDYLLTAGLTFHMWRGDSGGFRATSTYGIDIDDMKVGGYGGIVSQSGWYKVGMSMQIASGLPGNPDEGFPGAAFFVYILVDPTTAGVYDTLYIDWETSFAITAEYNGLSTWVTADWDFTNNEPHQWGDGTEVLATDFDFDGVNDYSMGSLANTFDQFGILTGGVVSGILTDGSGFALMYDYEGHGTCTAGAAAGRGIVEFDVFGNGTLKTVPGVAPGAKIMALKLFTLADELTCWFWGSGYRPREATAGITSYYEWDHSGYWGWDFTNQAHILSNSWGYIGTVFTAPYRMVWGCDWRSYMVDFLSTGGLIVGYDDYSGARHNWYNSTGWTWVDYAGPPLNTTSYALDLTGTIPGQIMPAPLFCISTGNAGPGYGTSGAPAAMSALMVGASTTAHYAQPRYNNDSSLGEQPYDQIADFSSNGPMPNALGLPDVVAPGAWAFDVAPLWSGLGDGLEAWTTFGGTSQSCPIAAGVAALLFQAIYEAGGTMPPGQTYGMIKTVLKSTADDLNQPALRQGAGRVNAWKAVNFGLMNPDDGTDCLPMLATDYTFLNYGATSTALWWRGYYIDMWSGTNDVFYREAYTHPGRAPGMMQGDAGFTLLESKPGDTKLINVMSAIVANSTAIDSLEGVWYELLNESSRSFTSTSVYTTFPLFADPNPAWPTPFDKDFMAQFMACDYAVIYLSYDQSDFVDLYDLAGAANYVFLHDWNDTNGNGFIDLQSATSVGEVRRVMYDYSATNVHQIHIGNPGDQWNGNRNATLYYHDLGNEYFLWRSLPVTVTIRLFNRVSWPWITTYHYGVGDAPGGMYSYPMAWNVTVAVPGDAMPGIYEGFLKATVKSTVRYFPVTVRVSGDVGPGSSLTWGESDGHPYDNGAITGALNWDGRYASGEWRFYYIDVSDINVGNNFTTWIMTNVTWMDPETCIDVMVFMTGYGWQAYLGGDVVSQLEYLEDGRWESTPTYTSAEGGQNVLFTDFTWAKATSASVRGYLMLALHVSAIGGKYVPENFTITVTPVNNATLRGYPSGAAGRSTDLLGPTGVLNCTSIAGNPPVVDDWVVPPHPHTTFTGTFQPYALPGFPSVSIRQTDLQLRLVNSLDIWECFVEANCTPGANYDVVYDWPGVAAGSTIEVHLRVDPDPHGDHDVDIFLLDPTGASIASSTNSGSVEDIGPVVVSAGGDYAVAVDYWGVDYSPYYIWGGWASLPFHLWGKASVISHNIQTGLTASADTYQLGLNTACDVVAKAVTGTSLDWGTTTEVGASNVTVTNFFAPTVHVVYPNGGETVGPGPVTINWTAADRNADEPPYDEALGFSVEVSNNSGTTWKVIVFGTTLTHTTWNPQSAFYGLPAGTQFKVRVNVTDGMYTASDVSDAVFTVLAPIPPPPAPPYELYTIIVVAVVVVVILLTTCVLKRRQTRAK